jgi:hypothetical protein
MDSHVHYYRCEDTVHDNGFRVTPARCECGAERVFRLKAYMPWNGTLDDRKAEFSHRTRALRSLAEER